MDRTKLIGPKIKALSNAMDQAMKRNTAFLDLTGSQAFILGYLSHHPDTPIYQKDIEREFDFSHPTVSGILQRLEAKGFVVFQEGEHDRRCKRVLVTEKAMQSHSAVVQKMRETEESYLAGMTEAEVQELHRLLGKVMENLGVTIPCHPIPPANLGGIKHD